MISAEENMRWVRAKYAEKFGLGAWLYMNDQVERVVKELLVEGRP